MAVAGEGRRVEVEVEVERANVIIIGILLRVW